MRNERKLTLCRHCIAAIRSREPLRVGELVLTLEESEERNEPCQWCGEYDDLYECE